MWLIFKILKEKYKESKKDVLRILAGSLNLHNNLISVYYFGSTGEKTKALMNKVVAYVTVVDFNLGSAASKKSSLM